MTTDQTTKNLAPDFDTTGELWDRIAKDLEEKGSPCLDTIEKLLEDSCNVSSNKDKSISD